MKMKAEKIKRTKGEKVLFIIAGISLWFLAGTYLLSFFFMFLNSFKDPLEYIITSKFDMPKNWNWRNYLKVFTVFNVNGNGYFQMCFHSIWFSLTGSVPALISCACCSYAYSRFKFPGRKIIFFINMMLLTISLPASGPAHYKLFCDLGMKNSPLYLIGVWDGFGSRFIIFMGFWKSIDWAYAEAVYMDGGNEWTVLTKVMMPQAFPMLGVFFILSFISSWNSHEFTLLYMDKYPSIACGLYLFQADSERVNDMPMYLAGLMVTCIPSLILYSVFQSKILETVNIGGLKG